MEKISVPQTLAIADPELKKKLVGKAPIQKYLDILETLDSESEIYQTLDAEIKEATGYEEPEEIEDSGVVVLPVSSIKALKTEIVSGLTSVGEKIDGLTFPEAPDTFKIDNFPKPQKFPDSFKVINFPKPITEVSISNLRDISPLDTVNVNEPKWYKPTDLTKTDNTIKLSGESVVGALSALQEAMHDPSTPVKVQIINKKGEVVESFGSVAVAGGGGGGGTANQPRNIRSGSTAVTTAATAVRLDPSDTFALRIDVQTPSTNTGTVYIGSSDVSAVVGSEKGIGLQPGDVYAFDMMSLDIIYLDSTVNGEGVTWNIFA